MKVAMVFDGLQIGGIERVGIDYVKMLVRQGHRVTVINLVPSLNEMEAELPKECELIHNTFPRMLSPEFWTNLIKRNAMCKMMYTPMFLTMSVLNYIYKIPFLLSTQKYDVGIAFSSHFNDLTYVASGFIRANKKACWLHGALYGYAIIADGYLNLYKRIKNLVVLVDAFQDEVLITNKQLQLNVHKLYNPSFVSERIVNPEYVNELKQKYGKFLIMVGRLDIQKDQLTLIKAVEYLKNKYGFTNKLLLVGDGPTRGELVEYINNNHLEEQVILVGNRKDVQNYYSAAHLFAHSSPLEGLPTTLIESLFFELPIVATDSLPGVREVLGNDEYGIITPVENPEKLGEAILEMFNNTNQYNYYKNQSKERYLDFSPEVISQKLTRILNDFK